jgi:hypothetical protein
MGFARFRRLINEHRDLPARCGWRRAASGAERGRSLWRRRPCCRFTNPRRRAAVGVKAIGIAAATVYRGANLEKAVESAKTARSGQ